MKHIRLSKGYDAIVDDEDFDCLSLHTWTAAERPNGRVYAVRNERLEVNRWRQVLMHRDILGRTLEGDIDHVNGNGLDNRRVNLRRATRSQNNANQRPQARPTSSRYKGVTWVAGKGRWRAAIKVDRRNIHLGYFTVEADAAAAYDEAARNWYGTFALTNGAFKSW